MTTTSTTTTKGKGLYVKLLELQKAVKALAKNEQAYGYQYVSGSKLLYFLRPMMDELGLLLLPSTKDFSSQIVRTREAGTRNGKPVEEKYENLVTLTKTFKWIDVETGESAEFDFVAQGCNDWDKGLGSAETYAERYFLLKFFHIATDSDDVDAIHNEPNDEPTPSTQKAKTSTSKQKPQPTNSTQEQSITSYLDGLRPNYYEDLVQAAAENPDALWTLEDGKQLNSFDLFMSYNPTEKEVGEFKQRVSNHRELFVNNK